MKKLKLFLLFIAFVFLSPSSFADSLEKEVVSYTLPNGMRFLLMRRAGAPVFAAYLRVKVGGIDEKPGKTGIAHMLEHMAFKGTETIGTRNYPEEKKFLERIEAIGVRLAELTRSPKKDSQQIATLQSEMLKLQKEADRLTVKEEFSRIYLKNGANHFNATTSKDITSYFMQLPANKLELWAYLESEKLKRPVFREFYQERDVVMEERRMRIDNDPFGKHFEIFLETAFQKSPYAIETIGHPEDLRALTTTDLQQFYKTYYIPQNIVGAIVGEIDIEQTKKLLLNYFGTIPAGAPSPEIRDQEPVQTQERRAKVRFDARPQIMIGFHKPTLPHRDDYVFDLIEQIFCEGRTSRLHQALVEKQKLVQAVGCDAGIPGNRLNNLFLIYATGLGNTSMAQVEKAIDEEIEKLQQAGVSPEELERGRNQLISSRVFKINSNLGLAELLSYTQIVAGDWRYFVKHEEILKSITGKELQAVAQKYLVKSNRTVTTLGKE